MGTLTVSRNLQHKAETEMSVAAMPRLVVFVLFAYVVGIFCAPTIQIDREKEQHINMLRDRRIFGLSNIFKSLNPSSKVNASIESKASELVEPLMESLSSPAVVKPILDAASAVREQGNTTGVDKVGVNINVNVGVNAPHFIFI